MKRYSIIYLSILFIGIFISCSPSLVSIQIETLSLSKKHLGLSDSINIAIVAAIYPDTRNDSLIMAKYPTDSVLAVKAAMSLKKTLEDSPLFSSYDFPVYNWARNDDKSTETGLPMEDITQIAENVKADKIITVDIVATSLWYEVGYSKEYNTSYGGTVVPFHFIFRLYDSKQSVLKDQQSVLDTARVETFLYGNQKPTDLFKKIPIGQDAIFEAVDRPGMIYAKTLTPNWITENRYFYTNVAEVFYAAEDFVREGDWANAMKKWMQVVDSKNTRKSAMACFNMSVGCEMMGDFNLAIEWLETARKKDQNIYIEKYHQLLQKRLAEKTEIDKSL